MWFSRNQTINSVQVFLNHSGEDLDSFQPALITTNLLNVSTDNGRIQIVIGRKTAAQIDSIQYTQHVVSTLAGFRR